MLTRDVRDYIATLNIAEDEHCYCGRLPDKKDKSIGIYPLKSGRKPNIPIGGIKNSSYGIKGISLLIHWSKSPGETEKAANELLKKIIETKDVKINEHKIKFIQTSTDEPIPVDTDDNGIYEYVIECLFYYERNGEE